MRDLEYLSDQLIATRNRLAEFRHGGIFLNDEELEGFIKRFDRFTEIARKLEAEISRREWNDRAARDGKVLDIDELPIGSNVVAFPGRAPDHRPTGGNAA
ncbi:hypothetical protein HB780_05595 (plasmid) [Rhizobium lusitanum]|uniref:hypothetical protein n=1 Tax=Rhizobium lusitanum TaxID=293958 RepID=UPI0016145530|nr:hypothetical protein [Rhizobium lusitanum]QND45229.1 hypothetical protein HB780_05595 [Rhizobium lusitanum]